MSGGEQQMLAIGRALMTRPRLLLLDEPTLGLAPLVIAQIFDIIREIREQGVTVFLVEQNANKALQVADRGYVLENGRVVLQDTGANLLVNDEVRKAYLAADQFREWAHREVRFLSGMRGREGGSGRDAGVRRVGQVAVDGGARQRIDRIGERDAQAGTQCVRHGQRQFGAAQDHGAAPRAFRRAMHSAAGE